MTERQGVITVFGSARPEPGERAWVQAHDLGAALARAGYVLCNGGYGGTMEAGAKGAKEAGGRTIGVTCTLFRRTANRWIDEEVLTRSLEERLQTLVRTGSGYVVLPGGTGTLLELAYVLEKINKEFLERRPIVLLGSFWQPVLEPLKHEMQPDVLTADSGYVRTARSIADVIRFLRPTI